MSSDLPLSLSLWLFTPLVMHNLIQLANLGLRSLRLKDFLAEHDFPSDDVNEPRYIGAGHRWFGLLTRYEKAPWRASELLMLDVVRFT